MQMVMVIFGASKASSDFRFVQKGFGHQILKLWKDLDHQMATRRAPRSSQEAPKTFPRGSVGVLSVLGGPKST